MSDYRVHQWIHLGSMEPAFSVQKRIAPRKWINVTDTGEALFFKTKENAKAFMKKQQEKHT